MWRRGAWFLLFALLTAAVGKEGEGQELVIEAEQRTLGSEQAGEAEGEGEEGAEGEDGEEHHHEVKSKDLTGALFLMGGVTFVMSLFYLVNHPDMDIREHTWKVINATVSIFVSILLFQGITGVSDAACDEYLSHNHSNSAKIGFAYCMFLLFYCCLHLILFSFAYQKEEDQEPGSLTRTTSMFVGEETMTFEQKRKRKMACWATLFSHMAGFAHIRCSLDLQQLDVFQTGVMAWLPSLLNALLLMVIFKLSDMFRGRWNTRKEDQDGYHLWEEGAEETEDDIAAIGISFSMVVVLRHCLTGEMANSQGLQLPVINHSSSAKYYISIASVVFALLAIAILFAFWRFRSRSSGTYLEMKNQETHSPMSYYGNSYLSRWIRIASSTCATASSWCGLYSAKWVLYGFERLAEQDADPNSCILRVILALLVSFCSFVLVYFLDKLKDLEATGEVADTAILEVIHAIGVSVGFAWEQAFDAGVETIGELTEHLGSWYPVWARMIVALLVAGVMIPAWRLYLIKKSLEKHEKCAGKIAGQPCGAVLLIDASYCHNCGRPVSKPAVH
ncbi:unnamed protein product [Effrenium voratum]|nr:unnamed protein product [Effrenium voratum]|mmetsp:Transcript_121484/g.288730  ORF Transcript_121484/g.288730 Transcript_121484/m.288730 type:complete len:560 (-) Transcript_121484:108-1787(-)